MAWFLLAVAAYAIMACSQVIDKVFLDKIFRDSRAYAVFVGLAGGVVFVALPWTQAVPSLSYWLLALIAGVLFVSALFPFLSALQDDEATRIIPLAGAIVPLATTFLERVFLRLELQPTAYAGIFFLVVGSVLLTASRRLAPRRSRLAAAKAVFAGMLFAASFVLSKYIYTQADFWTGFVWMRAGGVLAGLVLIMASQPVRAEISRLFDAVRPRIFGFYALNQAFAASGFALQNAAIYLSAASVVAAMQGVQYVFVMAFVLLFARFKPALLQEKITREVVLEKLTATACLITGLALLAV